MRATSAIVSAAGVLGVIAVVVVLGLDGGTESVGGEGSAGAADVRRVGDGPADVEPAPSPERRAAADAPPLVGDSSGEGEGPTSARLSLQVVLGESGAPVVGASVTVFGASDEGGATAVTDATGVARLERRPGTLRFVRVDATERSPKQHFRRNDALSAGAETTVRVELEPGVSIAGRVVDEGGAPVVGAEVTAEEAGMDPTVRTTSTAADGGFRVGPFIGRVLLSASSPSRVTRRVAGVDLTLGPPDEVVIPLAPAATLRVRVTGPAGTVAGARVEGRRDELEGKAAGWWWGGPAPFEAVAGADGVAAASVAPVPYEVTVAAEELLPWRGTVDPSEGEHLVRLSAGTTLTGTVRDGTGAPVEGARVRLFADGPDDIPDRRTGADGRFRFAGLAPSDDAALHVRAAGYREHDRE